MTAGPDGETAPSETAGGTDEDRSPWAEIVGPCYTVESFGRVLGLSPAAIAEAANNLAALRLPTADDIDLFPEFQVRDGRVYPDLFPVLATLRSGVDDPWTWAQWLNTEVRGEPSHMSRLWTGDLEGVLRDAGHVAWAWSS